MRLFMEYGHRPDAPEMKRPFHVILAAGVAAGGFSAGRWMRDRGEIAVSPAEQVLAEGSKGSQHLVSPTTDSYLCQIASGHLAPARRHIEDLLADPETDKDELSKLLAAIAMKDGASFDALVEGLSEERRRDLTLRASLWLGQDPARLLGAMAESQHLTGILLEHAPDQVGSAADDVPDAFLDLVERGEIHWPAETMKRMVMRYWMNKDAAARTAALLMSGKIAIDNPETIGRLMRGIGDEDLVRLGESDGAPQVKAALEAETEARLVFQDFKPTAETWKRIPLERMIHGLDQLVRTSGVPDFDWTSVPPESLPEVGDCIVAALPHDRKAELSRSIAASDLAAEQKNHLLHRAAEAAFHTGSDINLAMEFAGAIGDNPDGSNMGHDLIVEWVAYDPRRAKEYAASLPESELRRRILQRAEEVSP
jgi:hypothetical protein